MDLPSPSCKDWPAPNLQMNSLLCNELNSTCPVLLGQSIHVTEKAQQVLQILKDLEYQVYHIEEHLSHDGYDNYGPKSDIWELHVYTFQQKKGIHTPICLSFGWENWFYPNDKRQPYTFQGLEHRQHMNRTVVKDMLALP